MGDNKSGVTFIWVTLYFVLLGIILSTSNIFLVGLGVTPIGLTDNDAINFKFGANEYNVCSNPRWFLKSDGTYGANDYLTHSNACDITGGFLDENICNDLEGCTWTNETTFFFWTIESEDFICTGDVNITHYNNDSEKNYFSSMCTLSDFQNNETLCTYMGCTWFTHNSVSSGSSGVLYEQVKNAFTLRFETGLPSPYNEVILILMLYIPLLVLFVSLYFMLPFIH